MHLYESQSWQLLLANIKRVKSQLSKACPVQIGPSFGKPCEVKLCIVLPYIRTEVEALQSSSLQSSDSVNRVMETSSVFLSYTVNIVELLASSAV